MTKDEILSMAKEADLLDYRDDEKTIPLDYRESLKRFAALVAEKEREECAKFCETHQVWVGQGKRGFSEWGEDEFVTGGIHQGMDYAAAIRARGEGK
jgi:hypothetical protein